MTAPRIRIIEIDAFERDIKLRLPFRFGAATLEKAPQAFLRVRIEDEEGRTALGAAAEMMVPKWFDKNPALTLKRRMSISCAPRSALLLPLRSSRRRRRHCLPPPA